jgi:hypothetical protein
LLGRINAAHQTSLEVVHNPPDKCLRVQISNKSLNIKAELARIVAYRLLVQAPLMLIEHVMHLPEYSLSICSLGGNCGRKSMSMQFTLRENCETQNTGYRPFAP